MKGIRLTILITGIAWCFIACRSIFIQRGRTWQEHATATFWEALTDEAKERESIPIYTSSSSSTSIEGDTIQAEMTVNHIEGARTFLTTRQMREHSLVKSRDKAFKLSLALLRHPISMDTLNIRWDNLLYKRHVKAKNTQLRYDSYRNTDIFTDVVTYSKSSQPLLSPTDSLTTIYIGDHCEQKYTAFIRYQSGLGMLIWTDLLWLIPLVLFTLLYIYYARVTSTLKKFFYREREVPTFVSTPADAQEYLFANGATFNPHSFQLRKGNIATTLPRQQGKLLKRFMEQPHYVLPIDDIKQMYGWERHDNALEKVQSAISRLKREIRKVTPADIAYHDHEYILIVH